MLRDGMPVDVSGVGDWTGLHFAIKKNRTVVIKQLLNDETDVNRQNQHGKDTPLHFAARDNNTAVVQILIDHGADVNLINDDNKTPLDVADEGSEVERLLMQLQQSAS